MYRDGQGVRQDNVRAYMWLDLAARRGQYGAADLRDQLGQRMQPWQVDEARRMADAWRMPSGGNYAGGPSISSEDLPDASAYQSYDSGGMSRQQIGDLQWQLAVHGYDPGASDGRLGPRTVAAIRDYQADAGLPVDGRPSAQLLEHLQYAQPPVRNTRVAQGNGYPDDQPPAYQPPAYDQPPSSYQQQGYDQQQDYGPAPSYDGPVGVAPGLMAVYTVAAQEELARRGYYRGPIDGIAGRGTRAAILKYQRANGLEPTGEVSLELVNHLRLVTASRTS